MSQAAHTSTAPGNTLEERIQNYRTAQQNYDNIKTSEQLKNNNEWQNRLGTDEELQFANQVAENSLQISAKALSQKDINQAKELNLLSEKEQKQIQEMNSSSSSEKDNKIAENKNRIAAARDQSKSLDKDHDKSKG